MAQDSRLVELWYAAYAEPIGLRVSCSDPELFKQKLYQCRKALADETLSEMTIKSSPTNPKGEVWLCHKEPQL